MLTASTHKFDFVLCFLLTMTGLALPLAIAESQPKEISATPPVSFRSEIAPILNKKCLTCHGPDKAKGGYLLHNFEAMMKPGDNKTMPIIAGKPAESELYRRLVTTDADDRMPQKDDPLPPAQISLIERWIKEGAQFDGTDPKALLASIIPQAPHPEAPLAYKAPIPLTAVAFSPDGRELAVGGYHEVTIWDPAEGRLLRRIKNVAQRTQGLAYQPKGALLAVVGGAPGQSGEAALFDPVKGSLVKVLGTMNDMILSVSFNADGTRLAVGGADNSIHIYDVREGKEQILIQQHADWVMAVAFDPEGARVASASRDRTARVYDSKSGVLESSYMDHNAPVVGVAFGNDGKRVFSLGRDKKIHVWDSKEAKKTGEMSGFNDDPIKLVLAGDLILTCSADRLIRQHDAKERNLIRTYSGHKDWVYALDYSPQISRLASGSHDGEIRIWNTTNGELLKTFTAAPGYAALPLK